MSESTFIMLVIMFCCYKWGAYQADHSDGMSDYHSIYDSSYIFIHKGYFSFILNGMAGFLWNNIFVFYN